MKCAALAVALVLLGGCQEPTVTSVGGNGSGSGGGRNGAGGAGTPARLPDAGTGTPTSNMGPNPGDKNCGLKTFSLEQRPAELMLVLDRSGSMNEPAAQGSMTTKWDDVTAALNETIMKTESTVLWGLKAFPSGGVRCGVNDGVEVPSAANNHATVWSRIMANAPAAGNASGGTPTTVAIQKAVAYLQATPSMNPRYLVLATDGEPNCGQGGGFNNNDNGAAVRAVGAALAAGYKTFVIGVATSGQANNVLSQMATAGGEPRMAMPPYYPVANRQDLVDALNAITGLVSDCVFRLGQAPPSPDDVAVSVGNTRVTRDRSHMNGWDYGAANTTIQFYGPACEAVKNAQGQNVQIIFGCPGEVIP